MGRLIRCKLGSFHCSQLIFQQNRKLVGSVPQSIGYCVWSGSVRTERNAFHFTPWWNFSVVKVPDSCFNACRVSQQDEERQASCFAASALLSQSFEFLLHFRGSEIPFVCLVISTFCSLSVLVCHMAFPDPRPPAFLLSFPSAPCLALVGLGPNVDWFGICFNMSGESQSPASATSA